MLLYILLEIVLVALNIIDIFVLVKRKENRKLSRINLGLLWIWLFLLLALQYYEGLSLGLLWRFDELSINSICFYSQLITIFFYIPYIILVCLNDRRKRRIIYR